ncbi:MAG: ABC transporter ATP-binding protein [Bacillota bacterium]|nr:ABC transporter ATP-binding protein [Bacillota bacterium]
MSTRTHNGASSGVKTGIGRFLWMAKYAEEQEPGFVRTALAGKTVDVIRVLLPLYLSRSVLEAVFSGAGIDDVLMTAGIVTAIYFLLTVLSGYFQRKANYHYLRLMKKHQVQKALTVLEMDYEDTERDDVQNELVAIKQMERTVAMGIRTFQESFSVVFANVICIGVGIYLVWDLFFVPAAGVAPFLNWGLNIGYLGLIFILHYFAVKIDMNTMRIYGNTAKNIYVKNHRYLQQYSELLFDYKVGKDIRFYSEALGKRYNEVYRVRSSETYNVFFRLFSTAGAKRNFISGFVTVLTAVFVGLRVLWGSVALIDVFLCLGVLELLFRNIEELTEAFGKIISSDGIRKKFVHLLLNQEVWMESSQESVSPTSDSMSASTTAESSSAFGSMSMTADSSFVQEDGIGSSERRGERPDVPTVEFRHVSFKYPNSDVTVLKDVNLKVFGNQKLALVGLNGSGKTTLIKLLLGLYAPTEGTILIQGEDTSHWSNERFVSFFSAVFQDFKLFSLKIGENVAGAEEYDEESVAECLRKTGLSEFLEKNGTDGFLYRDFEEGGIEISGGEAQKIAMARAIYHGGKFFVLDEPTAALDPLSEYEIYTHFGEITSDQPAIYISHRLSSCIFCDVVAVMDKGRIIQIGTHEELLGDADGLYSELWQAQAKHYRNQETSEAVG